MRLSNPFRRADPQALPEPEPPDLALGDYDPNGCAYYCGNGRLGRIVFCDWRAFFHGDPSRGIEPDRLANPEVNRLIDSGEWDQVAIFVLNHEILHGVVCLVAGDEASAALDYQICRHAYQDWYGMAANLIFNWPEDYVRTWRVALW